MRAGDLDRRITIEQASTADNGYGEPEETWVDYATNLPAAVIRVRAREQVLGGAEQAQVDTLFKIRWRSDITNAMRISYAGDTYDIVRIKELGRREGLEIEARAEVS